MAVQKLSWSPPMDTGGHPVKGYSIHARDVSNSDIASSFDYCNSVALQNRVFYRSEGHGTFRLCAIEVDNSGNYKKHSTSNWKCFESILLLKWIH